MPSLTTSLRWMTPSARAGCPSTRSADDQRGAAGGGDAVDDVADVVGRRARRGRAPTSATAAAAPLRIRRAVGEVDAAHPGLRGERDEVGAVPSSPRRALAQPVRRAWRARRSSGPRGSRRPGWTAGRRRPARRRRRPSTRHELGGLPVAEGDGAGLVEQQRVHVAGGLDRAAGHGQHVALHQPVHAGDADRREQRADRGRDQADQQRDQHDHRLRGARSRSANGCSVTTASRKMIVRRGQQDVQRDLVGRLLPRRRPRPGRSSGR